MLRLRTLLIPAFLALAPAASPALAQGNAGLTLGSGLKVDSSLPVEVTSDSLTVNQTAGTATFTGNVLVVQGDMRLAAAEVLVEYASDKKGISRIHATGGVTVTSPAEAAEAREAVYTLATGALELTGNVILTQATGAISGERLVADLNTGTGRMEGRVRTVFQPGAGE